jgi:hypothetical protein
MSVLTQGWQDLIMTCEPFFPCDVCWGIEKETVFYGRTMGPVLAIVHCHFSIQDD